MIDVFRDGYDCELNVFHGRPWVNAEEVVVRTKIVCGKPYRYAEPSKPGSYAFGGTILFTSNGVFPEFNDPVKLHDRDLDLEGRPASFLRIVK